MKTYINIGDFVVIKNSDLWKHTEMRIINAEKKSLGDNKKFVIQMVSRLKKIQHIEKIYYAIAVLQERGHNDVVDIYNGKLIMEKFLEME